MKNVAKQIKRKLDGVSNVLVVIHQNPDGDALGSGTAMFEYLKNKKKNVKLFCKTTYPKNLDFLKNIHELTTDSKIFEEKIDALIVLDSGDTEYAGIAEFIKNKKIFTINIDHHKTNKFYGDLNMVDETSSSTCEMIYHLFKFNNIAINQKQATSLLTGLITDTGNFTNSATTTTALMIAGELVRLGANLPNINTRTIKNKTVGSLKLWGTALSRLEKHQEMDLAHTHLTQKDFKKHKVDEDTADGISNFLNNLEEAKIALVLKETKDGKIKGSFRTTHDDVDVARIAQKLGGGGHKKAAGFTTDGTVEEILEKIAKIYKENQV